MSAIRRSGRLIKTEAVKSKYFTQVKQETPIKLEAPSDEIIPKEPLSKRRKVTQVKVEVKQENIEIPSEDVTVKEEDVKPENDEAKHIPSKPIPKNFYAIYNQVKEMRSKIIAPVDTMGCAEIPRTLNQEVEITPVVYRFQLLISLMLSSQTKDEINFKAMYKMKQYFISQGFPEGLTLEAINFVDEKTLDSLIFSVGFHTRKASFIKQVGVILSEKYQGDIPNTLEGLVSLPGVGPKMAYLTLQKAWNLNVGIGVDVHVDRLSKMWGWVPKTSKSPEQTRIELEKWLPKELWGEINPNLVGFGQLICLPRGRRCDLCTLSKTKLCSNVDRQLLKKVSTLDDDAKLQMNKTLRGDISLLKDIEDLA